MAAAAADTSSASRHTALCDSQLLRAAAFLAACLLLSAYPLGARLFPGGPAFLLGALPQRAAGRPQPQQPPAPPMPPGVVGLWHPTLPHIPASIPAWAYDAAAAAQPGRFLDPLTNLTGPLQPLPPPHERRGFWPTAKAQGIEDLYAVAAFFHGLDRSGFVAESGALDGLQFSTTWWLVFALGWRAVHVEASPKNFASLVGTPGRTWGGRAESLNFNAALCTPSAAGEQGHLHYAEKDSAAPFPTDGIWEFFTEDYKRAWWPEALANESQVRAFAPVHCSSLDALLEPFEVPVLDLWVLDVEGGELSVLQSHDFEALPVNVLCVEADDFNPAKNAAVRELLEGKGFAYHGKFPKDGNPLNDWFVHSSFTPLPEPGYT